jgi:plasmid stabilization system protein ParE
MSHHIAPEAERDLDDIAYYIARETGSIDIAERLIDSITSRFYLLASHPRIGRARDDLLAGARSFPVGNHVIVYDLDGATCGSFVWRTADGTSPRYLVAEAMDDSFPEATFAPRMSDTLAAFD